MSMDNAGQYRYVIGNLKPFGHITTLSETQRSAEPLSWGNNHLFRSGGGFVVVHEAAAVAECSDGAEEVEEDEE